MQELFITILLLTNQLDMELAFTPEQRSMGMMYRDSWEPIEGMLFIHDNTKQVSYWMKNTPLNMFIIYIDEQFNICEIHTAKPYSLEVITSKSNNIKYVLEINPDYSELIFSNYDIFRENMIEELDEYGFTFD